MKKNVLLALALSLSLGLSAQISNKKVAQEREESVTVDFNGDSNASLRSSNEDLRPMYSLPDGYYYVGMSIPNQEYSEYLGAIIGPAYHGDAIWKNHSTGAERYEWLFNSPETPFLGDPELINEQIKWIKTTEETPNVVYPAGDFLTPTLAAINGETGFSYNWGRDINSEAGFGLLFCGGKVEVTNLGEVLNCGATNLDHHNFGITTSKISETDFFFGTNTRGLSSVGERFSKPSHPYVLEGIHIGLSKLEAPSNHEFQLIIHRVENDLPVEVIARATCTTSQAYSDPYGDDIYTLIFDGFQVPATNGGIEYTYSELVIEDEIWVELTNYNAPGVSIAVCDQAQESYYDKVTAYVYGGPAGGEKWRRCDSFRLTSGETIKTSLLVVLEIAYSYMAAEGDSSYTFGPNGGETTLNVISYYPPTEVEDGITYDILEFENLPGWLKVSSSYDTDTQILGLTFTAEALPNGLNERSALVRAKTPGSYIDLTLKQDEKGTNINTPEEAEVRADVVDKSIRLTYPLDFNQVTIYDIAGQEIISNPLPETGTYTLPVSGLSKGVYLLRLSGTKSKTIKISV